MKPLFIHIIFFLTMACLFSITPVAAQKKNKVLEKIESQYQKALESYKKKDYQEALRLLDRLEQADSTFPDLYFLRADIYHRLRDTVREIFFTHKGLTRDSIRFSSYYFILGEYYFNAGQYEMAVGYLKKYLEKDRRLNSKEKADRMMKNSSFALGLQEQTQQQLTELFLTSEHDVYWPSLDISGNTLLYTTQINGTEHIYMKAGQREIPLNLNSLANEGTQSLTADGQMIYFTGCGLPDSRGSCDIYVAYRLSDTTWSEPINLGEPINTAHWEAQPAISPDGSRLFFASNRPEGRGKSDIWYSTLLRREKNGRQYWSTPKNLYFNTPGEEMAPFLYYNGKTLYFSSDAYPGMGGMDIYRVNLDSVDTPVNIGLTVNTSKDEMGFAVDAGGKTGYFSSDRRGKKEIYKYELEESNTCPEVAYMHLIIQNSSGREIVPEKVLVQSYTTGDTLAFYSGSYIPENMLTCLPAYHHILISVLKERYMFYSDTLFSGKSDHAHPLVKKIVLQEIEKGISYPLKGVFFDFDRYDLKPESLIQLDQLVEFLKMNPGVKIEISGHTDDRGTETHNRHLSENRAFEVYKYLFYKRIDKDRMSYKGYGSQKPVAPNDTEQNRALNRRTEVKIVDNI